MTFDMKAFLLERKEVLQSCDLDRVIAFHAKWNPGAPAMDRDVAEIWMHKARTADLQLSKQERGLSKRWLQDRGYQSMDDGDIEVGPQCS